MKKLLFISTLFLFTLNSFSQFPGTQWKKLFGGTLDDYASCIQQTTDGGYIIAGSTLSIDGDVTENYGGSDIWVVKLSAVGAIEWQKTIGGAGPDNASSIQQTKDGGYILAGTTQLLYATGYFPDYFIVKLSDLGVTEWQKSMGGVGSDDAFSIQQTLEGGYIVAGQTQTGHGGLDCWIVKLSALGVIEWQKTYGGTREDGASSIQQTTDGGYVFAGRTDSYDGDVTGNHGGFSDFWLVKINSTGVIEWQKTLGSSGYDRASSVQQTIDGGYIMAGYTDFSNGDVTGFHGGNSDVWVVKLSTTGTIEWQKALGGTNEDSASSIRQTIDGGYIIAGSSDSTDGDLTFNINRSDVWIVKLNSTGTLLWEKSLGGLSDDFGRDIQKTADGGYVFAGTTSSKGGPLVGINYHGGNDFWIVKIAPELLSTNYFSQNGFTLSPNPTKSILNLQFSTATTINKIIITDLTGKTVLQQTQSSNQVNVQNLAKGMYILHAFSGREKFTNKFVKE